MEKDDTKKMATDDDRIDVLIYSVALLQECLILTYLLDRAIIFI